MTFKIFVSYCTKDIEEIKPILNQIQTIKDTEFFFADQTLNPGDHISQRIINYISNCDVFILFYSKSAYASTYVQHEIGVAKANDKLIIPILLDDTKPDGMLQGINYLNFYNQNKKQQEFERLYNYINQNVKRKNQNSALSLVALLGLGYLLLKSDEGESEEEFF
ncbi:toll/interleukin-1 receptor domain-containing protein [Methanolobus sediminis]|uniref:Toll/interleukin-1 receptor domain-containing protein n=1 Tax=Methanolobus sediminis TaxID=3072978 RepID=A0AA51UKB8_9EURY|nr:toll/interleukin-1 receptor domain-containing protein [Methanolobus sediminis]WMW25163.1 toll/interleukin-1 receptor domain-containing protein [Methanolobus sediminis]